MGLFNKVKAKSLSKKHMKLLLDNTIHTVVCGSTNTGKHDTVSKLLNAQFTYKINDNVIYFGGKEALNSVNKDAVTKFREIELFHKEGYYLNVFKTPEGVDKNLWTQILVNCFISSFGLGQEEYEILLQNINHYNKYQSESIDINALLYQLKCRLYNNIGSKEDKISKDNAYDRLTRLWTYVAGSIGVEVLDDGIERKDFPDLKELSISEILAEPSALTVINMDTTDTDVRGFIYNILLYMIYFTKGTLSENNPEATVIIDNTIPIIAGNTMGIIWNTARVVKMHLMLITNEPSKLPPNILANTSTYIIHRTYGKDNIESLPLGNFESSHTKEQVLEKLTYGIAVVVSVNANIIDTLVDFH